jgi:hypothetical protein
MNKYKWLPSEPTEEMMSIFTPLESYRNTVIKNSYKAIWQAAPEIEQDPVGKIKWEYTNHGYKPYVDLWDDLPVKTLLYTYPQPDQTELINQLTDELNKTEAERVKWMTTALTSQPKLEPLSNDEIKQIFEKSIGLMYWDFARAIEKAHGIGL